MGKMNLKQRRKALNLTMKQVAEFVGVSEATVSRWESGNIENMKSDKILRLAKALELSPMEIMPQREEYFSKGKVLTNQNTVDLSKSNKIPLVATTEIKLPVLSLQNIKDYVELPIGVDADFCFKVHGDSMINARITDGDMVFVKRQEEVSNGQTVVVLIENELTLKRIYKCEDSTVFLAENPLVEPIVIIDENLNTVQICGVVLAFLSFLP